MGGTIPELSQVTYVGDAVSPEWLRHLSGLPGRVWVENKGDELVIIHEFEDQKERS